MLALLMQRAVGFQSGNIFQMVVIAIAIIIGGGLLVWALKTAITNFAPSEWQPKLIAVMYIVIALILAALVFHWAGLI